VECEAKLIHEQTGDDDTDHAKHDRRDPAIGKDGCNHAEDADDEQDDAEGHAAGRGMAVERNFAGAS
jgi:hypothetical protein